MTTLIVIGKAVAWVVRIVVGWCSVGSACVGSRCAALSTACSVFGACGVISLGEMKLVMYSPVRSARLVPDLGLTEKRARSFPTDVSSP
jgi:hypothetical protein